MNARHLLLLLILAAGCSNQKIDVPPPANYILVIPKTNSVWAEHIRRGFEAGCKQLNMNCTFGAYEGDDPVVIAKTAMGLADSEGAPISMVFSKQELIAPTLDKMSVENRMAIAVGMDNSVAFRAGYVGMDAKKMANLIASRAKGLNPPAKRILYLMGDGLIDFQALQAAAFRESNDWAAYRLRTKHMSEVSDEDFEWSDLVVPFGEDALAKSIASSTRRIFPTDPVDASIELIKSGRAPFMIAENYFDVGFRASRIAREQFVYKAITDPIILVSPREVDKDSIDWYLKQRFVIPAVNPSKPSEGVRVK